MQPEQDLSKQPPNVPLAGAPNATPDMAEDIVTEASMESFPASDAPCWTVSGIGPAGRAPPP